MNRLQHLEEFRAVLADYHVSPAAHKVLADARLVLCSAATATGRNSVIRELLKSGEYEFIVSDTTRKPRVNDGVLEQNGVEYWFRSEAEILADLQAGKLVEAEIIHSQQVSGMSIREIEKAASRNKIAITDIDRGGVAKIREAKPDVLCLFFLPPSYEIWQDRLHARGDMESNEYQRRMKTAVKEYENALAKPYYTFVVNDDFAKTVRCVDAIVHGHIDEQKQQEARAIAQDILDHLKTL